MMSRDMAEKRQIRQEAGEWLVEMTSGHIGADLQARFDAWLIADPRHAKAYERMERLAGQLEDMDVSVDESGAAVIHDIPVGVSSVDLPKPSLWGWVAGGLAAAASVVIAVWTMDVYEHKGVQAHNERYSTQMAEVQTITLADGSSVTLGAGSEIAVRFTQNERLVSLQAGDAFFDVAKVAERPFTVQAGHAQVRVVGTRFEVKSGGDAIRVGVVDGAVDVQNMAGEGSAATRLTKGQVAVAQPSGFIRQEVMAPTLMGAWRTGRLIYEDATLSQIVADIKRYYGQDIQILSPDISQLRLTVAFDDKQVDQVLENITLGLPVTVVRGADGKVSLQEKSG